MRPGTLGLFVATDRELPHGEPLQVSVLDDHGPILSFAGHVATWVRGRGVRVEVDPGTPADVLDQLSELAERELTRVSPSTDLELRRSGTRVSPEPIPGAQPAARTALAGTRVLVIDDDPGIVRMLRRGLSRFGCEVVGTQDPPHGLELFDVSGSDVVLLDWMLPQIPGAKVLEHIRASHQTIPVAVISGALWWNQAVEHIRAQGATEVMEKPIDFERLVYWIQRVSGARTPAR